LNVPIRFGTTTQEFRDSFASALDRAAEQSEPELVLVSAGFDAHRLDPIGNLGLEAEDYAELTRLVLEAARAHSGGRVVCCLEGGYHWQATADSVQAHLEQLLTPGQS
jgi:acetoin utilization deacetylase AcuC-like enzyme